MSPETQSTAAVLPLQAPKDVSVSQIETELSKIWQSHGEHAAARAATFNLIVVEAEGTSGDTSVDAIAAESPCRVIDLVPTPGQDEGITAQVAAYCPIKKTRSALVCGEYITLKGTREAFNRLPAMLSELVIPDLPVFLGWMGCPAPHTRLFERLVSLSDRAIFDSASFAKPEEGLLALWTLVQSGVQVADLNWRRLSPWQELTAQAFDPPDRRAAVWDVDGITIDYERGNNTQALMFLGWIASRLGWQPRRKTIVGGDYDLLHIELETNDGRNVLAELAAIPVGDPGDVVGDLIGLRLTSSLENTDACNVFCSESMGCMRMEASGGAQSCRIHQVTPLLDQRADTLLAQQLQRYGREVLFEESLAVTAAILALEMQVDA